MVGSGVTERPRVELIGADSASGLADLLHQFLEQTVDASDQKAEAARALRGAVVVRAARKQSDRRAHCLPGRSDRAARHRHRGHGLHPEQQGDFLSVAHVTSGQASPMALVLSRQLRVSFGLGRLPFLFRVLGFMRVDDGSDRPRRVPVLVFVLVPVLVLVLVLVFFFRK